MRDGFDVDLRVVPEESYGAALQYFTGSKEHNISLRRIAQEKGLKLNEYGVFRGNKRIAGKTEEEVYEALDKKMESLRRTVTYNRECSPSIVKTMFDKNLAIVDLETTGMSPGHNRIIEIAIIRIEGNKIVDTFTSLINPETPISPFIINSRVLRNMS